REVEGSNPFAPTGLKHSAERILNVPVCVGQRGRKPRILRKSSAEGLSRMTATRQKSVPSCRLHLQSGQAIVTLTDGLSGRRDMVLGKYGTKDSRIEYARVLAEWEAVGQCLPVATTADVTVAELICRFWPWVQEHYRHLDGTLTSEVPEYKMALRAVNCA